jgi:hypothetical protein
MWKRWLLAGAIAWGGYHWWMMRPVSHGAGVIAQNVPQQHAIDSGVAFDYNGYRLTPLADYSIEARVLSREEYRVGREADLSQTDFALGWGRMSDEAVLKNIDISQSNRFFFWRVQEFPIPQHELETSASNVHLIPADRAVARQLDAVRRGQVVQLQGYLVRADASDGWHWVSSLTRDDRGAGACELLYVRSVATAR